MAAPFRPMLATVAERGPDRRRLGARGQVGRDAGARRRARRACVTVWSRNERDVTAAYPELDGIGHDYDDMLLDGEVVALEAGRPSFHALTERMHVSERRRAERLAATRPVTLMVFDLLRLFGSDLTAQPWSARRELLDRLDLDGRHWQVPRGVRRREAAARRDGRPGARGHRQQAPLGAVRGRPPVAGLAQDGPPREPVGGHRRLARGGRLPGRLGAVLVGLPDGEGGWRYAGRVGAGLAGYRRRGARAAAAPAGGGTPRRSPTRCRPSTRRARRGSSRGSSSRSAPSSSPGSTGCASRPTSGCAPT